MAKNILMRAAGAMLVALMLSLGGALPAAAQGVVATVNGTPVTDMQVAARIKLFALEGNKTGRRGAIGAEAEAAVSDPPEPAPPPAPPPPDPVPGANDLVEASAGHTLPPARLPDMVASPQGTLPLVRDPAARAPEPPASESAPAAEATGETSSDPNAEAATAALDEAVSAPAPELPPGSAEGAVIAELPAPPRPDLPPMLSNVMREVIARLLADPRAQAEPILTAAREEAYPDGVLARVYPDIAADSLDGITERLSGALRAMATDAGITADDLDAAVAARQEAVRREAEAAQDTIAETGGGEAEDLGEEGGAELAEVDAAEEAQLTRADAVVTAAAGEASPAAIDAARDRQMRKINRRVGAIRFDYEQAKLCQHTAIDRARALQAHAYDQTATDDQAAIDAAQPDGGLTARLDKGAVRNWANDSKRALDREVIALKAGATRSAETFRNDARSAGEAATGQVRDWADAQKGEAQGWWDRLWALFTDWQQQAQAEAENWSELRAGEARDATVQNMGLLSAFVEAEGEDVDLEASAAFAQLSEEQKAVVWAYYASPPGNRDSLGAVAAGLRHRLAAEQRQTLIEDMRREVLAKPDAEAENLEQIGAAETDGFSAARIGDELYQAMFGGVTGWGTDEERIYSNLTGLTPVQGRAVRAMYATDHPGRNLDADLASELDADNALIRARAALDGDVVMETVGALNEAMSGPGTDEDTIMRVLRGKTPEQRAAITEAYRRQYGTDLDAELRGEMGSHDLERAQALMEGDTARADAVALDQAMHGGLFGWGTDEDAIDAVYTDIRGDVAGQQVRGEDGRMRPMTEVELEAEVARRNLEVEASYDTRYGSPSDQESALRAAYRDELGGPDLDLANALADNDLVAADAARLERERQGILYSDDDAINAVLENQYARELDALQRDPARRAQRQALQEQARREGWDPYRLADAERVLDRQMEEDARAGAATRMRALETRYDQKYSRWGRGGLVVLIEFNMSGTDRARARTLRERGSLTRAERIDFATSGTGTDEAEFRRATAGLTAGEIVALNRDLAAMGRPSVQQIAREELSGRDAFDMQMTLRGVPQSAAEEMAQARDRTNWELRNSPLGTESRAVLERRLARMEHQYAVINDPNAPEAERARALAQFRSRATGIQSGVDSFRADVDAITDAVATTLAIAAAIAVTIATGGLAGAVLGALAAAAMTMGTKAALKGAAYGVEDMAVDAIIGVIDAAAAAATFGVGNALMRVATEGGSRFARIGGSTLARSLARMAASGSRTQRMLALGVAEGIEGAAGALPSALAGTMLDDKTWEQGNPLLNIVSGTLAQTGMGFATSGAMGAFRGIRMPHLDPPRVTGDLLAHRGTPMDRLTAWRQHKALNPDASMRDFLRQFDAATSARLAAQSTDAATQRVLRGQLLAGLPPQQRARFADTRIEILSDADFKRLTGSDSGNAVTLIRDGKPLVVLRDGAPPHVLREEGLHLQQIADPDLGRLARRLDERRLADWDRLPLAEKLELYAVKLELEIDAQVKLIKGLEGDMTPDLSPAQTRALADQAGQARRSLRILTARADEVAGFSLMDRLLMAKGLRDAPPWLDQPARLFNKGAPPPRPGPPTIRGDPDLPRRRLPDKGRDSSPVHRDARFAPGDTVQQVGGTWVEATEFPLSDGAIITHGTQRFRIANGRLVHDLTGLPGKIPAGTTVMVGGQPVRYRSRATVELDVTYREVEWRDASDTVRGIRQEAMSLSHADLSERRWVRRGSDVARSGQAAEIASQRVSEGRLVRGEIAGTLRVQHTKGTGFDGAEVHIGGDGQPVLRLIEVKNYPDGWAPYAEFTAVTTSFEANLDILRGRFELDPDLVQLGRIDEAVARKAGELGMDPGLVRLAVQALDGRRIELEIRPAPDTRIGVKGDQSVMNRLTRQWQAFQSGATGLRGRAQPLIDAPIDPAFMREANAAVEAIRASGLDPGRRRIREPLGFYGTPMRFLDASGHPLDIRIVRPSEAQGEALARLAAEIAQRLTKSAQILNGFHADLTLALDLSDLPVDQRRAVVAAVEAHLKHASGGRQARKRLIPLFDVR